MIKPVSLNPLTAAKPVDPELRKVAQSFEAVMLRQLIASMRKSQLGDDIFGSSANSSYREQADAQTADSLAERGAFGIASLIERQLQGLAK